jgi:hypothetical protein
MEKVRRSAPSPLFLDQIKPSHPLEITKDWLTCAEHAQRLLERINVALKLPQLTESERFELEATARTIQQMFTAIVRAFASTEDDRTFDQQLTAGAKCLREEIRTADGILDRLLRT